MGRHTLALVLTAWIGLGCSGIKKQTGPVSYSVTARKNYLKGVRALKKKNFEEAKKYFEHVRQRFVLSKYVVLAELRLADLLFKQGKYLTAAGAYQSFLKDHPGHEAVLSGYVPFQIALCHWRMAPSDFWLFPPAYEKDLTPVETAAAAFEMFLRRFPSSKYARRARTYLHRALKLLAKHDLYVARFYLSRGKPKGAILRLQRVLAKYPGLGYDGEVLLLLGRTYLDMRRYKKAWRTFAKLAADQPASPDGARAKLYLKYMRKRGLIQAQFGQAKSRPSGPVRVRKKLQSRGTR